MKTTATPRWGAWVLTEGRYLRHCPDGGTTSSYEVDLWEVDSHRELVDWLMHIGAKSSWYDQQNFYAAMVELFRNCGIPGSEVNGKQAATTCCQRWGQR